MEFRTLVELPKKELEIKHTDKILIIGSCFAQNMGSAFQRYKFDYTLNPYGVIYNPVSILRGLREMKKKRVYLEDALFRYGDVYHSFMHHGSFSNKSETAVLEKINEQLSIASKRLNEADVIFITFGSAYVYVMKDTGEVVANCHKLPDNYFDRKLLSVDEIVEMYSSFLASYYQSNPKVKVVFTISPIRHIRDGMHGCQLSKSTLMLAVNKLVEAFPENTHYFPSFEIMMDELRDYRFYADDMLHPSNVALSYIWETLTNCYFSKDTLLFMKEWDNVLNGLNHKAFRPGSAQHKKFLNQLLLTIEQLKEKYPNLDVKKELEICHTLLTHSPD